MENHIGSSARTITSGWLLKNRKGNTIPRYFRGPVARLAECGICNWESQSTLKITLWGCATNEVVMIELMLTPTQGQYY